MELEFTGCIDGQTKWKELIVRLIVVNYVKTLSTIRRFALYSHLL
jgi:hypothetical protein